MTPAEAVFTQFDNPYMPGLHTERLSAVDPEAAEIGEAHGQ